MLLQIEIENEIIKLLKEKHNTNDVQQIIQYLINNDIQKKITIANDKDFDNAINEIAEKYANTFKELAKWL